MPRILLLGATLSGLCAAWRLAELGFRVTVVDEEGEEKASSRLGTNHQVQAGGGGGGGAAEGAAPSVEATIPPDRAQEREDLHLQSHFPLILHSCHNFLDFLRQLGTEESIDWKRWELRVVTERGPRTREAVTSLPLTGMPDLRALLLPRWGSDPALRGLRAAWELLLSTTGAIPARERPSKGVVGRRRPAGGEPAFLHPVASSIFLTRPLLPSPMAAGNLLRLLFGDPGQGAVGMSVKGQRALWVGPVLEELEKEGAIFISDRSVERLELEGDQVARAVLSGGERVEAEVFVSSLPPWRLKEVLPGEVAASPPFDVLDALPRTRLLLLRLSVPRDLGWGNTLVFPLDDGSEGHPPLFIVLMRRHGRSELQAAFSAGEVGAPRIEVSADYLLKSLDGMVPGLDTHDSSADLVLVEREVIPMLPGVPGILPGTRTSLRNLYLCGDWVRSPFLSHPPEASVWTANRCVELAALDLLGKSLLVNRVNEPPRLLSPTRLLGRKRASSTWINAPGLEIGTGPGP